ncbi:hydroxyacylglutathione hydrolase [Legionella jordanis]|uniref:hydroxyacylglutathione hydrolase n=1 Tax=Legionella jordanis TaxID=456 RepID=UPI000F008D5C|nr:hydroxyacylglutathione hydrolase [Legionella jordanis]RMX21116.1 hydroxyacylglutathione hydrolase [Legionella jordanis]
MRVLPIAAFKDNYIWLIANDQKALCVDPGDGKAVMNYLNEHSLKLDGILVTHHHHDHVGGIPELLHHFPNLPVYGPKDARIPQISHPLGNKDNLNVLDCFFEVLETPGHTATHISYYEVNYKWLFCGDTLFSAGCGRVFDGTLEQLHSSLQKLKSLPDDCKVYCAHEYTLNNLKFAAMVEPGNLRVEHCIKQLQGTNHCSLPSTILLEKEINPFLRTDQQALQQFAVLQGVEKSDSLSVFKQLRAVKDIF